MNYITEATRSLETEIIWGYEPSNNNYILTDKNLAYASSFAPNSEQVVLNIHIIVAVNGPVNQIMTTNNYRDMSLLKTVITSLLRNRDFLGYQLSYYKGNLPDEQFDVIKQEYLTPNNNYDISDLMYNIILLMKNTAMVFDADQISTIFNCDIDIAEDALTKILDRLNCG